MIVETIKSELKKAGLSQMELAKLLTEHTGKKYNQSMVSKRLNNDSSITFKEVEYINEVINEFIAKKSTKKVKPVFFIKTVGGKQK